MDKLNLAFQVPLFTPMDLAKLDLEPLLGVLDVYEDTKLQILKTVQNAYNENSKKV